MMLYTKYESSGPCSFRQEDFFENCILKTYCLTPWPTYATNWNHLNKFGRGPPRNHSCEVWSKSSERFQSRRCLSKKVDGRRTTHDGRCTTTDDGQRPVTIAHREHFVLRWAKKLVDSYYSAPKILSPIRSFVNSLFVLEKIWGI